MEINQPLPLLGGLSPAQFMRRYWQKKPLLIRQAVPSMVPPIDRPALFALAEREGVESRLIRHGKAGWSLKHGPLPRRALPPLKQPGWTMLVQGVDLHHDGVHDLLRQFRFLPDARLDDLMISYASDTGGVGPHFDSYDVFLLQAQGQRHWSIGKQSDLRLQPGVPLKVLENFEPEQTFVLEPGDMLYLPPKYAHDGVAVGDDCMTYSIGLRSSAVGELGADLLARVAQAYAEDLEDAGPAELARYRDPSQPAVEAPAAMPAAFRTSLARQSRPRCATPTRSTARWANRSPSRRPMSGSARAARRPRCCARSCSTAARACSTTRGTSTSTARASAPAVPTPR